MEKTFKRRTWAIMYVVSIGAMISSCNKQDVQLPSQGLTVEQARMYLSQKASEGSGVSAAKAKSIHQKLGNAIDWGTAKRLSNGGKEMILAEISDRGIVIAKNVNARRYAVFRKDNGGIKMNIIESFDPKGTGRGMDLARLNELLNSKVDGSTAGGGQFTILYDEQYRRTGGNATVQRKMTKEKKSATPSSVSSGDLGTMSQNVIGVPCETWGVFLVTYDMFGNKIDEQLLYTFTTGDCSPNINDESIPPDYGGGSGQSLEDMEREIMAEFNRNISSMSFPEVYDSYGQDGVNQGVFPWVVVQGYFGWKIEAMTRFTYTRIPYRDVSTLQMRPTFNISEYKTVSSRYVGTNMLVHTTWSGADAVDVIHNNGTENAYGESYVSGTLYHKWKGFLPNGMFAPETSERVQNTAKFYPR